MSALGRLSRESWGEHTEVSRANPCSRTIFNYLKWLNIFVLLNFSLALSAHGSQVIWEGEALVESLGIIPDFSETDFFVLRVDQSRADLTVTVKNLTSEGRTFTYGFSAKRGLDEIFLIQKSECKSCVIYVSAAQPIDRYSPYMVHRSVLNTLSESAVAALLALRDAASLCYQATMLERERESLLQKCHSRLEDAGSSKVILNGVDWQQHIRLLRAEILYLMGDAEESKTILKQVLKEDQGTESHYAAHAYYELAAFESNVEEERSMYEQGVQYAKYLKKPILEAIGLNFQAVNLVRSNRPSEAILLLEKSYDMMVSVGAIRKSMDPLYNLSWAHQRDLNFPRAISYATRHMLLADRYGDEENAIWALYSLALSYGQMGERYQADKYIDEALHRLDRFPEHLRSTRYVLRSYLLEDRIDRLIAFGSITLAKKYIEELKAAFEIQGWPNRIADTLLIEARIEIGRKRYVQALRILSGALTHNRENNRTREVGKTLLLMAEAQVNQGQFVSASKSLIESLSVFTAANEKRFLSRGMIEAMRVILLLDGAAVAEQRLPILRRVVEQYGLEQEKADMEYVEAQIRNELGQTELAKDRLQDAKKIIGESLSKAKRFDLRREYLALHRSIFELDIALISPEDSRGSVESLRIAESAKAQTLVEKITEFDVYQEVSNELSEKRKEIHRKLSDNAAAWYSANQNEKLNIDGSVAALAQELEKVEVGIVSASQKTTRGASFKAEVTLARENLDENEGVVYYFLGERNSFLWFISKDNLVFKLLPPQSEIEAISQEYLGLISLPPHERPDGSAWRRIAVANSLSETILGPVGSLLDNGSIENLIVIPDGILHSLPFASLSLPGSDSLLLENFDISYAHSLTTKSALEKRFRNKTVKHQYGALVLANPISSEYPALPYSALEADAVKGVFDDQATVLSGQSATKGNLFDALGNGYDVLHLATHGLLHQEEPVLSGLLLSSEVRNQTDIWLSPEISSSRLDVNLVVLSACETSVGRAVAGEGLISLTRAFLEGGANGVIGSLWKVEDRATAALMESFYQGLVSEKLKVSSALRRAQIKILRDDANDWSDPYYWAALQFQGLDESL